MSSCIDVTKYNDLLIQQYSDSTILKSVISGFLTLIQNEQADFICNFDKNANSIDKATGWLLDRLGINFGYSRPTLIVDNVIVNVDDDLYKLLLKLWIYNIFYGGTTYGVNTALTNVFGKGFLYDANNLSADVWIFGVSADTIKALIESKVIPKVAGVRYVYYRSILNEKKTFGFAGSGLNTFGQGSFANEFIG